MDVDTYIARYRDEWKRLEAVCSHEQALTRLSGEDLEDVLRLYQRASTHLAEAKTRYRDPSLVRYLTSVVAQAHSAIYSVQPRTIRGAMAAFGTRYRDAIRRTRPHIGIAAILLVGVTLATALWVAGSREAQAGLLPPTAQQAVHRAGGSAVRNIPSAALSTFILLNNVQVAFFAFALGITAGVGTIVILLQNGTQIGALAGAFHAGGEAGRFWSLILPHGFLEISAICIAAGAGLRVGWSFIDPGDRSRSEALASGARDAVLVVVGVIPAFVVAAIIEGFITPSSIASPLKIGLGAVCATAYLIFAFGPRGTSQPSGSLEIQVGIGESSRKLAGATIHNDDAHPSKQRGR